MLYNPEPVKESELKYFKKIRSLKWIIFSCVMQKAMFRTYHQLHLPQLVGCPVIKEVMPSCLVFHRGWRHLIVPGLESFWRMLFPYLNHMLPVQSQPSIQQSSKTLGVNS